MLGPSEERLDFDLLIIPEATLILIATIIEPLRAANRLVGRPLYGWRLFSPDGAPVTTASGMPIPVHGAFRPDESDNPLIVVASYDWQAQTTKSVLHKLSRSARYHPLIIGAESGAWLMAQAGLLRDQRATAHWEDLEEFAGRHPHIRLSAQRFVIDDRRITTAGAIPTLDLMLDIIRQRQGYATAYEVARLFIYEPTMATTGPMVAPSQTDLHHADPRVATVVKLMETTIGAPLPVALLARRVGVTPRHLQSLFRRVLGIGPHAHYQALRLNRARQQVIETKKSFADIAVSTGFGSVSSFSRSYRNHYRETPRETRRHRGTRRAFCSDALPVYPQ